MITIIPKTELEALKELQDFFECDIWYAKNNEWKTESDMIKYLRDHFNICKNHIRRIKEVKKC